MRVSHIDHINISGPLELLDRCVAFYTEVLGLRAGPRPAFRSRGFWLYAGDAPIVHLTETAEPAAPAGAALNHVAFACEDVDAFEDALRDHEVAFTRTRVPATGQVQLFLEDPAGVRLELNFPPSA